MSKVSMKQAAKLFQVSRATLAKHRDQGKISGEKVDDVWQFDVAELARVYPRRGAAPAPAGRADWAGQDTPAAPDLSPEIKVLQAKLEAAEQLAEERARHIEDLRRLLEAPQDRPARRRWWPF